MITYLALFMILLTVLGALFYIITFFIIPDVPKGITTAYVLILILGATQLLSIAKISEYIGKILEETKNRPKFIIDKILNDPRGKNKD